MGGRLYRTSVRGNYECLEGDVTEKGKGHPMYEGTIVSHDKLFACSLADITDTRCRTGILVMKARVALENQMLYPRLAERGRSSINWNSTALNNKAVLWILRLCFSAHDMGKLYNEIQLLWSEC